MKTLKYWTIISVVVFMTCSFALAKGNDQPSILCCTSYLNADGTVNQATIEDAIADGADPIKLAAELVGARCDLAGAGTGSDKSSTGKEESTSFLRCCELAPLFAVAVVTAAPNVDIGALTAAVILACPEQAERVTEAILAAFPAAAGDTGRLDPGQITTFETTPITDYRTNTRDPVSRSR